MLMRDSARSLSPHCGATSQAPRARLLPALLAPRRLAGTLAPPRPSPPSTMAQWDSPPSAPAGLLAKLDRIAREPPPIPPRISQHPFYAESTPWTDVPAATRPELDRLGLWDSVRHLKDKGYAVIPDPAPASDIVALREAVASGWSSRPKVTTALLGVDPVYELAATNPVVAAMAEASLGQGFLLSSMGSSRVRQVDDDPAKRRTQGEELHCDQFMLPAPFPLQSQTLVFCWALNCPFTPENGATKVVEGSHHLRRHPTAAESASAAEISQPILAPEGALTCWDGAAWHAKGTRTAPGERLVLHMTFHRMTYRPVEKYSLPRETLERSPLLAQITGVDGHWGRTAGRDVVAQSTSWDDAVLKGRGVHPGPSKL